MGTIDKIPFLGLTQAPKIGQNPSMRVEMPTPEVGAVQPGETGAHIPASCGRVDDGNGNMISLGSSQGVGLAYVDPNEKNFWVA